MKRFIKINFGTNQKFIFNGRINNTYHEPDKRNGLLDVFQVKNHMLVNDNAWMWAPLSNNAFNYRPYQPCVVM